MSLPPYVPPTEEEFTELHRRLSRALTMLGQIGTAVRINCQEHNIDQVVEEVKGMRHRLDCLRTAVGL